MKHLETTVNPYGGEGLKVGVSTSATW